MFDLGTIGAVVKLDDSQYKRKLASMEQQSNKTFKSIAVAAGAFLSFRAAARFIGEAVKAYSDLEETTSKFNVIFRDVSEEANNAAADLVKFYLMSEEGSKKALSGIGDLLVGFKFSSQMALDLSKKAAMLGADLASFQNIEGGPEQAIKAITAAMVGETEQAKSLLKVVIRQDTAYNKRIEVLMKTKNLTETQAKAYENLNIIMDQSLNSLGDVARTRMDLANQERKQTANLEDFSATVGALVAGPYKGLVGMNNAALESFNALDKPTKKLILSGTALAGIALLLRTNIAKTIKQQILWAFSSKANAVANTKLTNSSMRVLFATKATGNAAVVTTGKLWGLRAAGMAAATGFKKMGLAIMANPIGAFLAIATGVYMLGGYLGDLMEHTAKLTEEQEKLRESGDKVRKTDQKRMLRLKELSSYTKLSNTEMKEAKSLIKKLNQYGSEQWAVLDGTNKRIKLGAEAQEKFNQKMREKAKLQISASIKEKQDNIDELRKANASVSEGSGAYWRDVLKFNWGGGDAEGKVKGNVQKMIALMKELDVEQRRMRALNKGENAAATGDNVDDDLTEKSKAATKLRLEIEEAEKSLRDARWDIKFNGLTTSIEKMAMMNEKIKETETLLRDKTERNQTLEKLELTEKLLRLKEQLSNLEKQDAEDKKREQGRFSKHSESYGNIDKDYQNRIKNKKIDRNISEAMRNGEISHARQMIQKQIELGILRAKQADEAYKSRLKEAMLDGRLSDKENKDLDRIKENKQKARAREEKYGDKLNDMQSQKSVNQTVGSFNAAVLELMGGGGNSPQERTAKASEKQVKVLKKVEKNTKDSKQLTY